METPPPSLEKPPEYSYFRAEGLSLVAVQRLAEARAEDAGMRQAICARFGAESLMGGFDAKRGDFRVNALFFQPPDQPVPPGWKIINEQSPSLVFALPEPGSADDFTLTALTGLMLRASRQSRLETLFGCGEMPYKELPAGSYSAAFVQHQTLKAPGAKPEGRLQDGRFMTYSNSPIRGSDPLASVRIGEDWYIRVPNIAGTATPCFTPPEARLVDYDAMLKIEGGTPLGKMNFTGPRLRGH